MVSVNLQLVEFMDARPLPGADIELSLQVVPRFPPRPEPGETDPEGEPTTDLGPQPDMRFAQTLTAGAVTDDEGRVEVSFDDAALFARLSRTMRSEAPRGAVDAVGFLSGTARFLAIRFNRRALAHTIAQDAQLEHTLPADLGMAIVGHTTAQTARLWFHLPFEPGPNHEFTCSVKTVPLNAPLLAPGPLQGAPAFARDLPVTFERAANTAVVDVAGLAPGPPHDYALVFRHGQGPLAQRFALVTGRFRTPQEDQRRLSLAFGSCHLPVVNGTLGEPSAAARRSLERWQRLADRRDFEVLLLIGDQIYGDGIEDKWPDADPFTQYLRRYRQLWAHRPTRQVLRSVPTYMILDDHDVADDFGIGNLPDIKVAEALRCYRLFQHAHNPGERDDQGTNVGPFHYHFRWGPAAFFVMDGRTQRGQGSPPTPVFGREQLRDLRAWAGSPETRAADVIFFVAPVPLALLPTEVIRQVADELTEQAGVTAGVLAGLALGLVGLVPAPFPGGPGGAISNAAVLGAVGYGAAEVFEGFVDRTLLVEADLGERWDLRENQADLVRLLDLLFDLANGVGDDPPRKRAVFILSGDIHAGTMHLIRSLPHRAGQRHVANPLITQLTSSALSHEPINSTLWVEAVSSIDERVDLDLKDVNLLTLAQQGADWERLSKEAIDVEDVFGEGKAEYFLDPDHDRRYLTQFAGLLMERTVGRVDVELRDPERRRYRFRLAIKGRSRTLESSFDLDLDSDVVHPQTDDASFVRQSVPRRIEGAFHADVRITMRNTGTRTWTGADSLRLIQSVWGVEHVPVAEPVRPGREVTFRFTIRAPSVGRFPLRCQMSSPMSGGSGLSGLRRGFGRFTPEVSIDVAGQGGADPCPELRRAQQLKRGRLEDLRQEAARLGEPSERLLQEMSRVNAELRGIERNLGELGCT